MAAGKSKVVDRRKFLKYVVAGAVIAGGGVAAYEASRLTPTVTQTETASVTPAPVTVTQTSVQPSPRPADILETNGIQKYVSSLVIPPSMPQSLAPSSELDYYEIAMRQFDQQVLPPDLPKTTVWGYGSVNHPSTFNFPSFTIEARQRRPVRIKWINGLINEKDSYLPHLLPVDQTLHWANPPGGEDMRDMHGRQQAPYTGPVPIVTHVHGAHVSEESDGYPEAWFLPAAKNIDSSVAKTGTWYDKFKTKFKEKYGVDWEPGTSVFQYPNDQPAGTLWYHDHTLGMTRLNVYAGPAGFYILRGGEHDQVSGLPGPAPGLGDGPNVKYYEIPLAIQDRTFRTDGSLFYPDNRAFFEGLSPEQLQIPFYPDAGVYPDGSSTGESDVAPIWNPEFFGNAMLVNGRTWPKLDVEPRRYRFRVLNGCNSRFVLLKLVKGNPIDRPAASGLPFWQIGSEGGFLPKVIQLETLLMAPAERADVIVDFTSLPAGTEIYMINEGPDQPFGGGIPGIDFDVADPESTGQVMKFAVGELNGRDSSLRPQDLVLPPIRSLEGDQNTRKVSLNEEMSMSLRVKTDENGVIKLDSGGEVFGPVAALLGTVTEDGTGNPLRWMDEVTEKPVQGKVEVWEIHNYTVDAHPIHVHQLMFQVIDRQPMSEDSTVRPPEDWEEGWKDTVIAYPGEITRLRMKFEYPGRYVWHCHIVEHEDNEMMRPLDVLPST